jgi:AraC-like DNA-binding protein
MLRACSASGSPLQMIDFAAFDLMARGGSLALLSLWSWLVIRDHWSALPARMSVLMNVTIACHLISSIPGDLSNSTLNWVVEIGSASVPGFFWLFTRAWFDDETRFGWKSWVVVAVPAIIILYLGPGERDTGFHGAGAVMRALWFGLSVAGLWTAWRGSEGDLVETRRRLRWALVGAVGALAIMANAVEIMANQHIAPSGASSGIVVGIALVAIMLCAALLRLREPALFATLLAPVPRSEPIPDDADSDLRADQLHRHMELERPYRNESLTIAALAAQIGEQEYRLRRLINSRLGHRNFSAFVNGYRLDDMKQALADPKQRDVPILTIALDAGFGSLGAFNRAFREAEGMTPSEYRNLSQTAS